MAEGLITKSTGKPDLPYLVYDDRVCACGEGPIWHPLRHQLYWVDVTNHKILTRKKEVTSEIQFSEFVTALAWIDENHLLAATETSLKVLNLSTHTTTELCPLEADVSETRSNDGRTDPWGGFWISTMGKHAEEGLGTIYRYYDGSLTVIAQGLTIPNAICFDKQRLRAYFADTKTQKLYRIELEKISGTPISVPVLFKDFLPNNQAIDGAVTDIDGNIWMGVWDGKSILCLSPKGHIIRQVPTNADRPTCPAFGGADHSDLFVTTAAIGLEESFLRVPEQGKTLVFKGIASGNALPRFVLPKSFEFK